MTHRWLGLAALTLLVPTPAPAQSHVRETAYARIPIARAMAADPVLVSAVTARNAQRESLDEIKRKDQEWTANTASPIRKAIAGAACADRLRTLTSEDALIVEGIVTDDQGANVCVTKETSDYWQGDEAKFQKTFGADKDVFVDEPQLDASSGHYAIQLSVLMRSGQAKVGVLTLTLRVPRQSTPGSSPSR